LWIFKNGQLRNVDSNLNSPIKILSPCDTSVSFQTESSSSSSNSSVEEIPKSKTELLANLMVRTGSLLVDHTPNSRTTRDNSPLPPNKGLTTGKRNSTVFQRFPDLPKPRLERRMSTLVRTISEHLLEAVGKREKMSTTTVSKDFEFNHNFMEMLFKDFKKDKTITYVRNKLKKQK
jgi:hypothetical protein